MPSQKVFCFLVPMFCTFACYPGAYSPAFHDESSSLVQVTAYRVQSQTAMENVNTVTCGPVEAREPADPTVIASVHTPDANSQTPKMWHYSVEGTLDCGAGGREAVGPQGGFLMAADGVAWLALSPDEVTPGVFASRQDVMRAVTQQGSMMAWQPTDGMLRLTRGAQRMPGTFLKRFNGMDTVSGAVEFGSVEECGTSGMHGVGTRYVDSVCGIELCAFDGTLSMEPVIAEQVEGATMDLNPYG